MLLILEGGRRQTTLGPAILEALRTTGINPEGRVAW
jgi:hypothetical protein